MNRTPIVSVAMDTIIMLPLSNIVKGSFIAYSDPVGSVGVSAASVS